MANDEFTVRTPAHWQALSHPLRLGILRELAVREMTNEELAKALGVASGKLYFHTKRLLDAGMIVPAGTRPKGAITEKLYRLVAAQFTVSPPVQSGDAPPLTAPVAAGLSLYQASWHEDRDLMQLGSHLVVNLPPGQFAEFVRRLREICDDLSEAASPAPESAPAALTVLLHTIPHKKAS